MLLQLSDVESCPGECEVRFHDYPHRYLFLIRALDFATERADRQLTGVEGSCLDVLKSASISASFDRNESVKFLATAVQEFEEWLNYRTDMTFWLPDLDINAKLNVSRSELLHISGNYSKHNIARLTRVSKSFHKILIENGYDVEIESIPFAIDYFCDHLNENYFIYQCTWLSELLNNIRWAIYDYLYPVFTETYIRESELSIRYDYPEGVSNETSQKWYWGMMDAVLRKPYFKRFKAAHYLKGESSLEREWD